METLGPRGPILITPPHHLFLLFTLPIIWVNFSFHFIVRVFIILFSWSSRSLFILLLVFKVFIYSSLGLQGLYLFFSWSSRYQFSWSSRPLVYNWGFSFSRSSNHRVFRVKLTRSSGFRVHLTGSSGFNSPGRQGSGSTLQVFKGISCVWCNDCCQGGSFHVNVWRGLSVGNSSLDGVVLSMW